MNSNSQDTKPTPIVSVVIPAYNMEAFIAETLDSVLASDYPNFEVVVVDDGSSDNSYAIAQGYAKRDKRVRVLRKENGGVSSARNMAISQARGELILPVDSDNIIEPTLISKAVKRLTSSSDIKVVVPTSDFFGEKTGIWRLPPFNLNLLARKNIMDNCALYRKSEWQRVGGYCEQIVTREDWAFWISILKDGGRVEILPEILHHYRTRSTSKRVTNRDKKFLVIDKLNNLHPEFFERELHGPLRHNRSWSKLLNTLHRITHPRKVRVADDFSRLTDEARALPAYFRFDCGKVIHEGRNQLRELQWKDMLVVAKSFQTPNIVNRIAYGLLRSSKAQRSFEYASILRKAGIGSPTPVAYYTERAGLLFSQSYYVSLKSECHHTYADLIRGDYPNQEPILREIARTAAKMHSAGMIHKDFSQGNILFRETGTRVEVEIVDLNRIHFQQVDMEAGCRNFERLPANDAMIRIMADEYARHRSFNTGECFRLMRKYNKGLSI